MCRNQLGRRNITREQRDYLLSQEYEAQCKTVGGDGSNQYEKKEQLDENHQIAKGDTRAAIAKSHNISQYEVQKAVEFGRGLDAAEKVSPGIKEAVLSGSVKESKKIFIFARLLRDSMGGGVEVIYYPPPVCYDGVTTRDDIELMFGTDIESKAGPQTRERAGHT